MGSLMLSDGTVIADGVDWTQNVFAEQIKQVLNEKFLDITRIDQLIRATTEFRTSMGLSAPLGSESVYYPGLHALHCTDFERMHAETKAGIPDALLHVLGIDDRDGAMLLGAEGWPSLLADLTVWNDKAAAHIEVPATDHYAPEPSPRIPVTRSRKSEWLDNGWKRIDKVVAVALVAGVVGLVVMLPAKLKPATTLPSTREVAAVQASEPILPVLPASRPLVCGSEGGTCAIIETERPGSTLRELADVAGALPVIKGSRYRVELSVVPVDAADLLPEISVRQTATSSSASHVDNSGIPRPGTTSSSVAKHAND